MTSEPIRRALSDGRMMYNFAFEKTPTDYMARRDRNILLMKMCLRYGTNFENFLQAAKEIWEKAKEMQMVFDTWNLEHQKDKREIK